MKTTLKERFEQLKKHNNLVDIKFETAAAAVTKMDVKVVEVHNDHIVVDNGDTLMAIAFEKIIWVRF